MKNQLILTIFAILLFASYQSSAQLDVLTIDYKQEFLLCDGDYEKLQRKIGQGQGVADTFYVKGKRYSGCAKQDYAKNKMYYILYFKNGFVEKQVVYYYNGHKSADFNSVDGKPQGFQTMYFDNGQKYTEDFYTNGKLEGYQRRWHSNGQLAREVLHKNGKVVYEYLFDKDGKRTN